ncbi:PQQ-dependent sugar dehydrogenase [Flavihumibacter stibioxidans]|uniref:Sorbosone dehydrogenase n=1 Tax=Flavihumibacter stibioxidans TaxID=1834163 RepID=A0ABR7MBH0_9BACT|nr:PQQ-dependent sugar dehydrogenase [Flavihumibacter stibioxidans]MBC6492296.1 sorbosone dehydrogenase [Flavihumibacter stibioxidans]
MLKVSFFVTVFSGLVAMPALAGGSGCSDTSLLATAARTLVASNAASEIKVPAGFVAGIAADGLGNARHIAAATDGILFVKLERLKNGKGIFRLEDANKDGVYENITGFGNYGGTGIAIKNGYLYASSNEAVYRYRLNEKSEVLNPEAPDLVVTGLLDKRQHESKSIALDNAGNLYVNIGAPSNACQLVDRTKGSPGQDPCPILETAGGIWRFKADGKSQSYADGTRYATGLRNVVGLDWNNEVNELFVMQHGRDQLSQLYPEMFDAQQNAETPAEEMFMVKEGADCGWPFCYYDLQQKKKLLGPEYGGDGKKVERCAGKEQPIMAFPAHMAPNALLFYTGNQFPAKYRNGAFIAFHGSWNRAPLKQEGYYVVFVPFQNGKPTGNWEVFADGFAGVEEVKSPRDAKHRPCGLAQGADGSLYVTDDVKGTVYRITYKG